MAKQLYHASHALGNFRAVFSSLIVSLPLITNLLQGSDGAQRVRQVALQRSGQLDRLLQLCHSVSRGHLGGLEEECPQDSRLPWRQGRALTWSHPTQGHTSQVLPDGVFLQLVFALMVICQSLQLLA